MAPRLESVSNDSGKSVHVDIGVKSFDIDNDASHHIDISLTTDGYTKINIGGDDSQGYLMKYDVPNIKINDALGKKNDVTDSSIHLDSNKQFRLNISKGEMNIMCDGKSLGIYHADGSIIYFVAVTAKHMTQGGITVDGGIAIEGDIPEGSDA